jgi:hypothetical protein
MNAASADTLELRALMQRDRIQRTAHELIGKVDQAREQLSPPHIIREHFGVAALVAGATTFFTGYVLARS